MILAVDVGGLVSRQVQCLDQLQQRFANLENGKRQRPKDWPKPS